MTQVTTIMRNMTTEELIRHLRYSEDEFENFIADRLEESLDELYLVMSKQGR